MILLNKNNPSSTVGLGNTLNLILLLDSIAVNKRIMKLITKWTMNLKETIQ
jgi:hypothetical protein